MKYNIGNVLFCIGFFLLQLSTIFVNVVFLHTYLNDIKFISLIILLMASIIKLGKLDVKLKTVVFLFILTLISIYSYVVTEDLLFIKFFLVLLASIHIPFDKLVKYDLSIKLVLLFSLLLLYYLGFTESFVVMRGYLIRKSFGFYHPNTFAMFLTLIYFEFVYLKKKNIKLNYLLLGFLITFVITKFSDSRTAILCLFTFLLFLITRKVSKLIMKSRVWLFLIKNLFLVGTIVTIVFTLRYLERDEFAVKLNELFSYRLYLQGFYLLKYDIKWLGNMIDYVSTLDNAYLRIILNYGIITSLLFDYIYRNIIKKAYKNKNDIICIIFLIFMAYAFMENLMFDIVYNVFWLYFTSLLFRGGKNEG